MAAPKWVSDGSPFEPLFRSPRTWSKVRFSLTTKITCLIFWRRKPMTSASFARTGADQRLFFATCVVSPSSTWPVGTGAVSRVPLRHSHPSRALPQHLVEVVSNRSRSLAWPDGSPALRHQLVNALETPRILPPAALTEALPLIPRCLPYGYEEPHGAPTHF